MKAKLSVNLFDKAVHTSEVEANTSIARAVKYMHLGRVHVSITGDHKQFSPIFYSVRDVNDFPRNSGFSLGVNFKQQLASIFEILLTRHRFFFSCLYNQYRTHPHLANPEQNYVWRFLDSTQRSGTIQPTFFKRRSQQL